MSREKPSKARLRSAQAGAKNLADWKANRSARGHGIYALLAGAAVPNELKPKLDKFESRLIEDLGGESSITAAKSALIASSRLSYAVILLAQSLLESSYLGRRRRQSLSGVLATVSMHQNSLKRNLELLGVERLSPAGPSLEEYLSQRQSPSAESDESDSKIAHETDDEGTGAT